MKNNNNNKFTKEYFGFNDDDLIFLFGKNKSKAIKSLEVLHEKYPEYTDYDVLDILSKGHGREAYVKLSNHRIRSNEYINNFKISDNRKLLDIETNDGKDQHINRNKNQYDKAPKNLRTMYEFVKRGYFIHEGYDPCKNLKTDDISSRKEALSRKLYLIKNNLLNSEEYQGLGNISFRGTPGSSFEGCQFVYNKTTGELVTDFLNRGTWDYGKFGSQSHADYDIIPWIKIGNGANTENKEMFIMSNKHETLYLKTKFDINDQIISKLKAEEVNVIRSAMSSLNNTTVDPEFVLKERQIKHDINSNNVKIDFIKRVEDMPLNFLETDWNNYISFCSLVDDKSLIDNLELFVSSMESDPCNLKSLVTDENKLKYKQFLLKSSFSCIDTENFKEGMIIKNDLPVTITINLDNNFITKLQSNGINDESIKEFHKIRDEVIIPAISKKLSKIGFKCRVLDDVTNIDSFESFTLTISQLRTVSKEEKILVTSNQNKVTPKEEFATEELNTYYTPEYSLEGIMGIVGNVIATVLVSSVFGIIIYLFEKHIWSKNRKIVKIITDNIHIIEEPIMNDFKKYTTIYNKFIKDATFINSLYTNDKYGKYLYTTNKSDFSKDSFMRTSETEFSNDIIMKLYYAFKSLKYKYPKEIKQVFENIQYTYVVAEGKPLYELINNYNKEAIFVYNRGTSEFNDHVSESTKTNMLVKAGSLKSAYKAIVDLIRSSCGVMERKGFDVKPIFYLDEVQATPYSTVFGDDYRENYSKAKNAKVAFYLCMNTSITLEQFLEFKNLIESKLAEENDKAKSKEELDILINSHDQSKEIKMINNDNIFAIEEYKPEQSTEGLGMLIAANVAILLINQFTINMAEYAFDNRALQKDRKFKQAVTDNIHIIAKPIMEDYKKYVKLYKQLINDKSFLEKIQSIDEYGKYKFIDKSGYDENTFVNMSEEEFTKNIIKKLRYTFKELKRKSNPKKIQKTLDETEYSFIFAKGKLLYNIQDSHDKKILWYKLDKLYLDKFRELSAFCNTFKSKGFDISVTSDFEGELSDPQSRVILFHLNMPTSITVENFIALKNTIKQKI